MGFTPYGRRIMLGTMFGLNTAPTTAYLALSPTIPTSASTSEFLVEPGAAEYARKVYGYGANFWAFQGWAEVGNSVPIQFVTPASDWGMLRGWALTTGLGVSDIIVSGPLRQPRRAAAGTTLIFAVGALRCSLR